MAKHVNKDRQIAESSRKAECNHNPHPWKHYPEFPTTPSKVVKRYPTLENANVKASEEYLAMWTKDQVEWDMTDDEVVDHSYTSYKISMSDKRGYLTAIASNVPRGRKLNWIKECDQWDLYDTRTEAEAHLAEDFFHMLGCYTKIRGRVVDCGGMFEVQLEGYYLLKPKKEE